MDRVLIMIDEKVLVSYYLSTVECIPSAIERVSSIDRADGIHLPTWWSQRRNRLEIVRDWRWERVGDEGRLKMREDWRRQKKRGFKMTEEEDDWRREKIEWQERRMSNEKNDENEWSWKGETIPTALRVQKWRTQLTWLSDSIFPSMQVRVSRLRYSIVPKSILSQPPQLLPPFPSSLQFETNLIPRFLNICSIYGWSIAIDDDDSEFWIQVTETKGCRWGDLSQSSKERIETRTGMILKIEGDAKGVTV